eukprot:m.101831 g.101831  ORF g.101831 m.101831 type:complete len:542 (+) comp15188_c0_seq1:265-1890(+)
MPPITGSVNDDGHSRPLVQRYRQLIANVPPRQPAPARRYRLTKPAETCRYSIAAVVSEQDPSKTSPRLHSSVDGKDQLLELHEQAPDALGTLPDEDVAARNARYKSFFDRLDLDNTGHISQDNLHAEMERIQLSTSEQQHATRIMDEIGAEQGAQWEEFQIWCAEKEQLLRQVFDAIDHEQDGKLQAQEIRAALIQLNLEANDEAVGRLLEAMGSQEEGHITWRTWREHMMWSPTAHVQDVFRYWTLLAESGDASITPVSGFKQDWWRSFIAGGVAGAVSRTCTAPLDRLKLLMHVTAGKKQFSILQGFQHMRLHGGFASMWRGNGVNVLKITPESGIRFLAWNRAKEVIYSNSDPNNIVFPERFAAGAIAGVTAQISIFPLEVVKTRLATAKTGVYKGFIHCIHSLYREGGIRFFYRGLQPALVGIIPYAGIDLAVYDALRSRYSQHYEKGSPFPTLAFGVVSSTCGQVVSYPFALVRTRLQADSNNQRNMLQELKYVYRMGGIRALYRGWGANLLKAAPAVSISYVIFENTMATLDRLY